MRIEAIQRRVSVAGSLAVLSIVALGALVLGSERLEAGLPGGLPLGNAVAAASVIFAAGAATLMSRAGTMLRGLALLALVLALIWLPASIALAGNVDLNFGKSSGGLWLAGSAVIFLASYGALLLALASSLLHRNRPTRAGRT
jgi:hypothetical protein